MKVSDIVSRVRRAAGDTESLQFTDSDIMQWINDATKECASDNQLLQKSASSVVAQGTSEYTLPPDILKLHSVKVDNSKISMLTLEEFDSQIGDTDGSPVGSPSVGYVWATKLNLYPAPDNSSSTLLVQYTRTPEEVTELTDDIDLPVMYHRRIVDYCLAMVAEQDDDEARYNLKMSEFKSGIASLKDQDEWTNDLYPSISVAPRDMGNGGEYEW